MKTFDQIIQNFHEVRRAVDGPKVDFEYDEIIEFVDVRDNPHPRINLTNTQPGRDCVLTLEEYTKAKLG